MQMDALKQKFSDFTDDAACFIEEYKPLMVAAAVIYGVTSMVATGMVHNAFDIGSTSLQDRSASVFNQMAGLQHLNDKARGHAWTESMKNIAYDIRSDGIGWNWKILNEGNGGRDLIVTADNANIALIPHKEAGKPAALTVDNDHGCLQVDFSKTDEENKDLARALLRTFRESREYNAYGTYTAGGDGKVSFTPFRDGQKAADICPAAPKAPAAVSP